MNTLMCLVENDDNDWIIYHANLVQSLGNFSCHSHQMPKTWTGKQQQQQK